MLKIPVALVLLNFLLVAQLSCQKNPSVLIGAHDAFTPPPQASSQEKPKLVFAGLSGTFPRFIDEGPFRGMGWQEFQTQEVRKALENEGFDLSFEYMTPARITHEFRSKRAICTYPVEWNMAETSFAKRSDRILSIPLDLGGEVSRRIIIRAKDAARFKPFLDAKGDVRLEALLPNAELKTSLLRDKDYGKYNSVITEVDPQGERYVRPAYAKHIALQMVHERRQLIEMLIAKRFDYILFDRIEDQDFKLATQRNEPLQELSVGVVSAVSADDPKLIRISIACSDHPHSIRAIPILNQAIALQRGIIWVEEKLRYRQQLDTTVKDAQWWIHSAVDRFRGELLNGHFDQWYSQQEKVFPGLRKLPARSSLAQPLKKGEHQLGKGQPILYRVVRDASSGLTIQSQSSLFYADTPPSLGYDDRLFRVFKNLSSYFTSPEIDQLSNATSFQDPSVSFQSVDSLVKSLDEREVSQLKGLTIFAEGMDGRDAEALYSFLGPKLKRLRILNGPPDFIAGVEEGLRRPMPSLEEINLSRSLLRFSQIGKWVSFPGLKSLILDQTGLTEGQMVTLFPLVAQRLERLSLSHLSSSWSKKTAAAFGALAWPKLRSFSAERAFLGGEQLDSIALGLPNSLIELNLSLNRFHFGAVKRLVEKPWSRLTILKLNDSSPLIPTEGNQLRFPSTVKHLELKLSNLTADAVKQFVFPDHLAFLDLSENPIGDDGLEVILSHLDPFPRGLLFSGIHLSATGVQKLASRVRGTELQVLDLSFNSIGDEGVATLIQKGLVPPTLDLKSVLMTDRSIHAIANSAAKLRSLNVSQNPLTNQGIELLLSSLPSSLRELNLESLPKRLSGLSQVALPKGLRMLSLANNQLDDHTLSRILAGLPDALHYLNLKNSSPGEESCAQFRRGLPSSLQSLDLGLTPLSVECFRNILEGLPVGTRELAIGNFRVGDGSNRGSKLLLPPHLSDLYLEAVQFENTESLFHFFSRLPKSLLELDLEGLSTEVTLGAYEERLQWPPALRFLRARAMPDLEKFRESLLTGIPKSLEGLQIHSSGLTDYGFELLGRAGLSELYLLHLSGNQMTAVGLKKVLEGSPQVRYLDIQSEHSLSDAGLDSIGSQHLGGIQGVMLGNLKLTHAALRAFLRKLPGNLSDLDLQSMKITTDEVQSILDSIPQNADFMNWVGNPIGAKGFALIEEFKKARAKKLGWHLQFEAYL